MRYSSTLFLLSTLLFIGGLNGQDTTGSIAGTVQDPSGAGVPNAKITITDTERNLIARSLTTGAAGDYSAALLPAGVYSIAVEAAGFKKTSIPSLRLTLTANLTVNIPLEVGQLTEQVNVEASAVSVELQSAAAAGLVNGTQIRELQLNSRNFAQLITLVPGVSSANTDQLYIGAVAPAGSSTSVSFAVNGARSGANSWQVDGADNVDRGSNLSLLTFPSVDSLAEFKVLRTNYSAEFGRAGGGQVNVITKSGTSRFHGSAYEFVRNNAFAANNFINNANSVNLGSDGKARVPPLRYNDFGYTVGGPVFIPRLYNKDKNKTFFFFSQEFRRVITYSTPVIIVPTGEEKTGAFPRPVCVAATAGACTQTTSQITNINSVAAAYLKDVFSLAPNGAQLTNQFFPSLRNTFNQRQELYKIDHVFGPKLSVSGRYLRDNIPTTEPQGLFSSGGIPGVAATSTNAPGHSWVFRATAAITPTWLNEAGYNYSYGAIISRLAGTLGFAASPDIKITLPFTSTLARVPSLSFGGGGTPVTSFGPYDDFNRNHSFYDNMTRVLGRHTLRFGFVQNFYQKTENAGGGNQGSFTFSGTSFPRPAGTSIFEQAFAEFLLGTTSQFTQSNLDVTPDIRDRQTEMYIQDDFRLRPNFTLNVGARYSIFRQPYDAKGMLTAFDPSAFDPSKALQINPATGNLIANSPGDPLNGLVGNAGKSTYGNKSAPDSKGNIAPRIGFAWDPFKKGTTSIRSGYGIYYDSQLYGIYEQNIFQNPPFVNSVTIPNTRLENPNAGTATVSLAPKVIRSTPVPYQTPYTQQWNLEIQHQIGTSALLSVGYFGSKGTHLLGIVDLNEVQPGLAIARGLVPPGTVFTSANTPLLNSLRPYQGYNVINSIETWFNSNYHSLQVNMEKRLGGSSLINLAYTYSKNLTDNQSDRSNAAQNTYNRHDGEYGRASFDRRHIATINYVYEIPFLKTQKGLVGHALGGWEISGITQLSTGLPLSPASSLGRDPAGLGIIGSSAAGPRPDWACNPNVDAPHTRQQYFNTSCFVDVPAGVVRPGNAGRGTINGPGLQRWDVSLFKNVKFGERASFQFRAEGFNVFNHTNPNGIGTSLGASTYGQITSYRDPRLLQLAAKFYF